MDHCHFKKKTENKEQYDCHVTSLGPNGYDTFASLLTDSGEEQIVFIVDMASSAGTRLGKQYLKNMIHSI